MSWAAVLENPKHLGAFFDDVGDLDDVSLFEVTLDREGARLRLRANLSRFPDRPSPRWPAAANRAQIILSLWDVRVLSIEGWTTTVEGRLAMRRTSSTEVEFSFQAPLVTIQGRCGQVRLDDLTGHIEGAG